MSLFNRALRPPPTASDEAIARSLAALRSEVRPDPLFQRRLRSDVVNRFVAAREGIGSSGRTGIGRGRMGQLGRACLYASCTLALSAASVLAASQEALRGEFLYPLKQRIEQLRIDVVPNHLHAELAGYALGERIEEMERLADAGQWDLAAEMAPGIEREFERLVALGQTADDAGVVRIERHMVVLEGLIANLPSNAREAVQTVVDETPRRSREATDPGPNPRNPGGAAPLSRDDSPPETSAVRDSTTPGPERTPAADPAPTMTPRPGASPGSNPRNRCPGRNPRIELVERSGNCR